MQMIARWGGVGGGQGRGRSSIFKFRTVACRRADVAQIYAGGLYAARDNEIRDRLYAARPARPPKDRRNVRLCSPIKRERSCISSRDRDGGGERRGGEGNPLWSRREEKVRGETRGPSNGDDNDGGGGDGGGGGGGGGDGDGGGGGDDDG